MKRIVAAANDAELDSVSAPARHRSAGQGTVARPLLQRLPAATRFARTCPARRGVAAFTLVDALLASGILVIFVGACLSAIFVNQIVTRKVKEEAIAMDFLTKYVENIKALPFDSAAPGQTLNWIYNLNIPADTNWVSLSTTNYLLFYPDLTWMANRNPKMSLSVRQTSVSGAVHDRQFNIKFDWDPPLKKGAQLEVQVDFLRTANVPTL